LDGAFSSVASNDSILIPGTSLVVVIGGSRGVGRQIVEAAACNGAHVLVGFLDGHPRHPSTFGGQGIAGPHQGLFLHEHLLARSLPLLPRHHRGCVHSEMFSVVLHVSRFVPVHVSLLFLSFLHCW
jgi:hypothetical protein